MVEAEIAVSDFGSDCEQVLDVWHLWCYLSMCLKPERNLEDKQSV